MECSGIDNYFDFNLRDERASITACSKGADAISIVELAGIITKHIIVHPNAQVAQSVEQRTENPRVGSSILTLGTNSLSSLAPPKTLGQLGNPKAFVA